MLAETAPSRKCTTFSSWNCTCISSSEDAFLLEKCARNLPVEGTPGASDARPAERCAMRKQHQAQTKSKNEAMDMP
jgi:hypothetical protein